MSLLCHSEIPLPSCCHCGVTPVTQIRVVFSVSVGFSKQESEFCHMLVSYWSCSVHWVLEHFHRNEILSG